MPVSHDAVFEEYPNRNALLKPAIMKISFTHNIRGERSSHEARAEQRFQMGDGHGDFCLTAYGETREEAHENLRQLALRMVRELDAIKGS